MTKRKDAAPPRSLNLALQGGGSHGAFTWGVLDRLLEEADIAIEGISGTSAGAMNAASLAQGMMTGGRAGAREDLRWFWETMSDVGRRAPLRRTPFDRWSRGWNLDWSPAYVAFDMVTRLLSPYQFNPLNVNPLRDVLERRIDFDRLRQCTEVKLFVSATNVRSGNIKVFRTDELSADVLLASACLPLVFQAVEIDGEHYWDGGYMGNPALYPLIYHCDSRDLLIVGVNPIRRDDVPTGPREILNRVNEISFNSSLLREIRAIEFVRRLLDSGALDDARYKRLNIHYIDVGPELLRLGSSSKFNLERDFLDHLFAGGRDRADAWLRDHGDKIGVDSSVDLREAFL